MLNFRFESYATIEINGKYYMTPRDFLDSVIYSGEDTKRTKIRRRKVSPQEHGYMLHIGNEEIAYQYTAVQMNTIHSFGKLALIQSMYM